MRCDKALDRMLEADPVELRGGDATELGRHIAGCARCSRVAAALAREVEGLDGAVASWAAAGDVDAALDAVLAAAGAEAGAGAVTSPALGSPDHGARIPTAGRARPAWVRHAWIPLAAAAALTGVLLLDDPDPRQTPAPVAPVRVEAEVAVHPPEDRSAAIMRTRNPEITIVWLYDREDES